MEKSPPLLASDQRSLDQSSLPWNLKANSIMYGGSNALANRWFALKKAHKRGDLSTLMKSHDSSSIHHESLADGTKTPVNDILQNLKMISWRSGLEVVGHTTVDPAYRPNDHLPPVKGMMQWKSCWYSKNRIVSSSVEHTNFLNEEMRSWIDKSINSKKTTVALSRVLQKWKRVKDNNHTPTRFKPVSHSIVVQ